MRKMIVCTLVVIFGFMNFSFGQNKSVTEKISIQTYDEKGILKQTELTGNDALLLDIPSYIKENDQLGRLTINGYIKTDLATTIIRFDSNKQEADGDYICKNVNTILKPFIGVKAIGRDDLNGVDLERVVYASPAAIAGINISESIMEFDGEVINSYCDLTAAVNASEIGETVEVIMKKGARQYSKYITIGSREVSTVTYKYCDEEQYDIIPANELKENPIEATLTSYPNPTRSLSQINFTSTSDEDVIFRVMGITGQLIHQEVITDYTGNLRIDYNLENESDGTYIMSIQQGNDIYKHKVQLTK